MNAYSVIFLGAIVFASFVLGLAITEVNYRSFPSCNVDVMSPNTPISNTSASSKIQCATRCSKLTTCFSFNLCLLLSYLQSAMCAGLISQPGCKYYESNNDYNPCQNGGSYKAPSCTCSGGYTGDHCESYLDKQLLVVGPDQDSEWSSRQTSERALDGDHSTVGSDCAVTRNDAVENWWQGQLGEDAYLTKVKILNRYTGVLLKKLRVEGFLVDPRVAGTGSAQLCAEHPEKVPPASWASVTCIAPVYARYFRITKAAITGSLGICEVEVYGGQ